MLLILLLLRVLVTAAQSRETCDLRLSLILEAEVEDQSR
jgi:hypothetical protein